MTYKEMKVPKETTQRVEHERFALTRRLKWQEGDFQ